MLGHYSTKTLPGIDAEQTRRVVTALAEHYGRHPIMRFILMRHVLGPQGVRTRHADPRARAIHRWVRDRHWFAPEPGEQVLTPGRTIAWGFGDCDDLTALVGALLVAGNIPWRPMLLARTGPNGVRPFHIWPQALTERGWVDLETVEPDARYGEHPAALMSRLSTSL